jgi:hypothetical protein
MGVKIKPHPPFFSPSFKAKLGLEKSAFEDRKKNRKEKEKGIERTNKTNKKGKEKRKQNEGLTVICKQT